MNVSDLPALNASLNALSTVFIALGWWFIRQERKPQHIAMMICALVTSTVFLGFYLYYHFHVGAVTKFTAQGWIRPVYFFILISHIILAFTVVPLVLMTVIPAIRQRFDRHRRVGRWTMPIWLYASSTGLVVYWMIYHLSNSV